MKEQERWVLPDLDDFDLTIFWDDFVASKRKCRHLYRQEILCRQAKASVTFGGRATI